MNNNLKHLKTNLSMLKSHNSILDKRAGELVERLTSVCSAVVAENLSTHVACLFIACA